MFQRQAPSFVPDPAEVRRRASKGCPPALVELALHCCLEDPIDRPKMPEVLARLRDIELEVLSRLDNETEHVGSIRILQHTGKRAMPIFQPVKENEVGMQQRENDGEASDQRMEEDALEALAKLQVDGTGAARPGEGEDGKDTWRTARWEERPSVITQWSDASEMRGMLCYNNSCNTLKEVPGHQRLLPSDQSSSSFESGPPEIYQSSFMRNVGNASVIRNANPPDDTTSTMTIKASPSETTHAAPGAHTDLGPMPPTALTAATEVPPSKAADIASASSEDTGPALPAKIKTKADVADEEAARQAAPPAHGTHRFTLIEKEALALLSGKKPSTCECTPSQVKKQLGLTRQSRPHSLLSYPKRLHRVTSVPYAINASDNVPLCNAMTALVSLDCL
jgi:LIM domain kinase 1